MASCRKRDSASTRGNRWSPSCFSPHFHICASVLHFCFMVVLLVLRPRVLLGSTHRFDRPARLSRVRFAKIMTADLKAFEYTQPYTHIHVKCTYKTYVYFTCVYIYIYIICLWMPRGPGCPCLAHDVREFCFPCSLNVVGAACTLFVDVSG